MKRTALLWLVMMPLLVWATQGYRVVHPDGTVEFTDQPVKGAEEVTLPEAQKFQAPDSGGTTAPANAPSKPAEADGSTTYQRLAILSPAAESTIFYDEAGFNVAVSSTPQLQSDHQVVVYLDGKEVARGKGGSIHLPAAERGAHQLGASIVDGAGTILIQASSITIYVHQHSTIRH